MDVTQELAAFLRTRRERLDPRDFGLPARRQARRTPGLRREEVAELAGVSTDYIVRLEQARGLRPSAEVVEALARALRLTPDERAYLFGLARQRPRSADKLATTAEPLLARLVADLSPLPAMLMNHRYDILAWNSEMARLLLDFRHLAAAAAQCDVAVPDASARHGTSTSTANVSCERGSPTCALRGPRIQRTRR